jgi:hypothetical protein
VRLAAARVQFPPPAPWSGRLYDFWPPNAFLQKQTRMLSSLQFSIRSLKRLTPARSRAIRNPSFPSSLLLQPGSETHCAKTERNGMHTRTARHPESTKTGRGVSPESINGSDSFGPKRHKASILSIFVLSPQPTLGCTASALWALKESPFL